MAAKKMGRPPIPKADRKGEVLTLRLTKEEHRAAEAAARRLGVTISTWARRVIADAAGVDPG